MEELLTTEPGPPKGAKPVNGIAKTIAPPAGAKKKEDTVSEPSLNDGSTQAGLDVSQEPGPKGAKPLGKSTESKEQELFNRYSADLEKGLLDLYSKKYKTEEDDFIKSIGGFKEPDLTNKDEVDSYNKKVNQLKEFQQKRGKEIDDEFKNHYETSTKSALERFNKNAIKKAERATEKSPASPFVEELKNAPRPISINPEKDARKIVSQFQTEITGKPESQGLVQDAYLASSNVPGAINKAFVSGMAATPKTVAMLAQKLDQLTGMPAKGIEEYATYQLGEYVENKAKELGLTVLQNPDYAGFMTSTLPQAVGSMLSMMLLGGRGATTNPFAAQSIAKQAATTLTSKTAMVGAMQASVPEFEAAKAAGKTDEEAFNVFLQNIPGGLTESVQMANMFGRLNRMTNNGLMNAIKLSTANGLEEASQEAIQQYLTNKVAQGSYDPERDLKEGMGEGAGAGFIVGFVMPGAIAAMDKMTPEQRTQTKAVLQKMLEQGYYVRTPESFRKTIKSPSQVVSEARTSVKSADDTQGAENAAEKILEVTQESTKVNQDSANLTLNEENLNKPSIETTGETPSLATESKSLEAPVQEEQGIGQGTDMEFTQLESKAKELSDSIEQLKQDNPNQFKKDGTPKAKSKITGTYKALVDMRQGVYEQMQAGFQEEFNKRGREESEKSRIETEQINKQFEEAANKDVDPEEIVFDEVNRIFGKITNEEQVTPEEVDYVNQNAYLPKGYVFTDKGLKKGKRPEIVESEPKPIEDSSSVPPATPGEIETQEEGKIYNNDAIFSGDEKGTQANITPELTEDDKKYGVVTDELTIQEAKRIVSSNPLGKVEEVVFADNDMHPKLKRVTALELAKAYREAGDTESSLRVFGNYRKLGTSYAQGTQAGIIAAEDPLIETMNAVYDQSEQNKQTRKETHADGQTTGQKLDATQKEIEALGKRFGVEVSELDSVENVIDKILVKGVPKSEKLAAATKRVKDSKQKLKELWAAAKNPGVIYDFKREAGKQVALDKAIIEVVRAVVDEYSIRTGQKISEVIDKVITQINKILAEIGIELRSDDLNFIINEQTKAYRPYTPPITIKEREDAGSRIVEQILGPSKQGKAKPAIQEFYDRVVKRMVGANPKLGGKSKEDIMREVVRNLDKYADVLTEVKNLMESQGVDTKDIDSIFELPYFEKQIQKKVTADEIKKAIKEHYDVSGSRAQSLADKLIKEYGLTGTDAKAIEKIVHEEFGKRMKVASEKELTKLYGTSQLKKPKASPKTDAEKINEAFNMGAFQDNFYTQLVGQKFGITEFSPENIAKMEEFANRINKLPEGEVRDRAFQEYNEYIDSLKDSTLAYKMFAFAKDYWRTSVLSGYTTWARMIKGSFLTAPVHITLSVLSNPKATLMSGRAIRAVIRGWKAGGWNTFKRIMFSGENTFDGENRSPRGYLQKLKTTSLKDLINNPERSALGKSADVALKFFVKPLTYTVNSAAAIETTMFRYPLKELETYYAVYNEMVKRGMKPKEQAFWDAVDKAMAVDQPTIDEAQARLNDEMDILRASGEKIPDGYENRRLHQIIEGKRDVNIVKYAADKANSAVLMNQPGGYAGWVTRGLSELGTADKDVGAIEATASYLASLPFAFVRVATSQLNTGAQFIPVMGYLYNAKNTIWESGSKKNKQTRDKTSDEQRRVMAAQVIGTTVMTAFALALFDWEWDDEDKDAILPKPKFKKDSRIRVTGMGLGAGKYSENKQIAPDYKEMSIQFQYSDGTWSDPYSYRDSPIGMIIYPLGQISDEIRFKEFKNKTDQENTDRTNSALLLSAANQTWNFAMSQSYMTGINGMVDIIGFSGSDRDVDILLKAVTSPVAPFVMPNLYKQTYQQVKAFTDTPDRDIRGVFKKPMQDVPIIEEYVGGERTDMFGYPMVRKFEIPLVPDYLLVALKENRDYRLDKKEWQLLYKYPEVTVGMPFKAPVKIEKKNFFDFDFEGKMDKDLGVKKMPSFDDKDYVKLTDDQKLQWEESAKNYFKEEINNSYDVLNKNSPEMLQYNLNTLKSKAKARASMEVAPKSILERLGRGKGRNAIDVEFPVYR